MVLTKPCPSTQCPDVPWRGPLLSKGEKMVKRIRKKKQTLKVLIMAFIPHCSCWGSWEEGSWEWSCPGTSGSAVGAVWQRDLQIQSLPCPPCTLAAEQPLYNKNRSQNHRIAQVGKGLKDHWIQPQPNRTTLTNNPPLALYFTTLLSYLLSPTTQ